MRQKIGILVLILTVSASCQFNDQGTITGRIPQTANVGLRAGPKQSCGALTSDQFKQFGSLENKKWTELLAKYVSPAGQVDYLAWSQNTQDSESLDLVVEIYGFENFEEGAQHRLARTINLYNAATVQLIVRNISKVLGDESAPMPLQKSIRNIDAFDFDIWNQFPFEFEDKMITLNSLENDVIRKFLDPRIHFAINCASKGCPRLAQSAFEENNLDTQLDIMTCEFVNGSNQTVFTDKNIESSMILLWFWDDFKILYENPQNFFKLWSGQAIDSSWKINYKNYDWTLNEI